MLFIEGDRLEHIEQASHKLRHGLEVCARVPPLHIMLSASAFIFDTDWSPPRFGLASRDQVVMQSKKLDKKLD